MKYLLIIILTALIVGIGVTAYFKGWLPSLSFNKPQATSVQNSEVSNALLKASPTSLVGPSPTPETDNNQTILVAVRAALVTKRGLDFSDLNYSINKVEGNYASGTVNGSGGGGMWFAAKVNGSWVIVSDGNGVILCSDLAPYPNFPRDMVPECWDTASNKLIIR